MAPRLKGFDLLESAVNKGFDRVTATSDQNTQRDTDVTFYENLTPEAFDVIAATYGPDNLVQYVTAMESRRMKGTKNGNQSQIR